MHRSRWIVVLLVLALAGTVHAECGNGIREGTEACDGADLGGYRCADETAGPLACHPDCTYDWAPCRENTTTTTVTTTTTMTEPGQFESTTTTTTAP